MPKICLLVTTSDQDTADTTYAAIDKTVKVLRQVGTDLEALGVRLEVVDVHGVEENLSCPPKISEVIILLQKYLTGHGDVPVYQWIEGYGDRPVYWIRFHPAGLNSDIVRSDEEREHYPDRVVIE